MNNLSLLHEISNGIGLAVVGIVLHAGFASINRKLNQVLQEQKMAATQQDLDNALSNIEGQIQTLGTDLQKSLKDLTDKIASSGTTVDFTPEVGRLQAIGTALAQFDTEATGDDPGPAPVPVGTLPTNNPS